MAFGHLGAGVREPAFVPVGVTPAREGQEILPIPNSALTVDGDRHLAGPPLER